MLGPGEMELRRVEVEPPQPDQLVVESIYSGVSAGTERLLWEGRMPSFPGMGYPLVPGYETVAKVVAAPRARAELEGRWVFVPGARCFASVRGLFGGAASRLHVDADRVVPLPDDIGEQGVLLALAATAEHALARGPETPPDLIVGHGVLGRLIARLSVLRGGSPTVWERSAERRGGARGYRVVDPATDEDRGSYRHLVDASGDCSILDSLVAAARSGASLTLAGFYGERLSFDFASAFIKEVTIRVAAEWKRPDIQRVAGLLEDRSFALDDLITHRTPVESGARVEAAYNTAFGDPSCLKMVLDWRKTR